MLSTKYNDILRLSKADTVADTKFFTDANIWDDF